MGRILKILAYLVGGVIALGIIVAITVALLFDPNDYKDDIAAAVKEQTGRDLVIEGDLELTVFPWLAIQVGATELSNGEGFGDAPFARFDTARVGMQLIPLIFGGRVEAGTITLDGLNLNLAVNAAGRANWQDFLDAADAAPADDTAAETDRRSGEVSGFNVQGVELSNTHLRYTDAQTGTAMQLTDLTMSLGQITTDSGVVSIDGIDIDGLLEGATTVPTTLALETDGVAVDLGTETLSVEPLAMSMLGLDIRAEVEPMVYGDDLATTAAIAVDPFSLRNLMERLDIEPPPTADPAALGRMRLSGTAQLLPQSLSLVDLQMELDDTTFTGDLAIPRGDGEFVFTLHGDAMNLDRYMAPAVDGDGAGGDGDSTPIEIPVELLRLMNARGSLDMSRVTLTGIELEEPEIHLALTNGDLRLRPITATVFNGEYHGDVRVDATGATPVLSVNERIQGVELGALAKAMFDQDNVTGAINGEFRLSGRGADMAAVQRSLSGNLSMNLLDGAYEGADIWYELRKAYAAIKQRPAPPPPQSLRTAFDDVGLAGSVTNGVLQSDDLRADLPFMQIRGAGSVNFLEGTIDYRLSTRVLETPDLVESGVSEEDIAALTSTRIPIRVTGSLLAPTVRPDIEQLLRDRAREEIEDAVQDKLRDLFDR